ncbi:hypothetical protein HPB50_000891 [Hyalomma asiaticum]|uniref:Uncharacterized protein n=1 Tax=Hyalomma asiaticum TaxID=266040 RepID=A0ACB7SCN6_HYAAI|nr:hypothetical protein HPB50_000891 [Hyalomma asiaticum]
METDQLRLSEMAYLHVPDKERSKSPSPCDSLASSATDISTLPIHDRTPHHDEHVSEIAFAAHEVGVTPEVSRWGKCEPMGERGLVPDPAGDAAAADVVSPCPRLPRKILRSLPSIPDWSACRPVWRPRSADSSQQAINESRATSLFPRNRESVQFRGRRSQQMALRHSAT